jgi:hypothetical protein
MSVSISDSGSFCRAHPQWLFQRDVEEFTVGELGERISQAFGAYRRHVFLQVIDFLLGNGEAFFQLPVEASIFWWFAPDFRRSRADPRDQLTVQLLRSRRETFGVTGRRTEGGVDHRHGLIDFALDLVADFIDALGQMCRRQIVF